MWLQWDYIFNLCPFSVGKAGPKLSLCLAGILRRGVRAVAVGAMHRSASLGNGEAAEKAEIFVDTLRAGSSNVGQCKCGFLMRGLTEYALSFLPKGGRFSFVPGTDCRQRPDNILTTFFKKQHDFCHVRNEREEPKTVVNKGKAAISGGFRMVELRGIEPRSDNRTLSLLRA